MRKVVAFENLKVVSLQSATDTSVYDDTVNIHAHRVSHFERSSKTDETRSKSSIGCKRGRWRTARCTDCHKRISLGNPRTQRDRMRARATFWREKISVQEKISGSARKSFKGFENARRALRCAAQNESLVSGKPMHASRRGTELYMHRATRPPEGIRARTFANSRGMPTIFLRARRKRNRVIETRGIWTRVALWILGRAFSHFGSLSLRFFSLNGDRGTGKESAN